MPHVDLDAFLAEQNADPLVVTFKGRDFEAPAEIPWTAFEKAQELQGLDLAKADTQRLIGDIITLFLGKEAWEFMGEQGIGPKASMKIVNALLDELVKSLPEGMDPKKMLEEAATAAHQAARPSPLPSRTQNGSSGSSRPTSEGSTPSSPESSPGSG